MSFVRRACLAAIVSACFILPAHALSYRDIAGKWCGRTTDYNFTRDTLTVTFHDGSPTKRFEITSYEYQDDAIVLNWINAKGERVHTDFAEFSDDGDTMAQQRSDAGPRRPFRRCDR